MPKKNVARVFAIFIYSRIIFTRDSRNCYGAS